MTTYEVEVTVTVAVTLDETKFTKEFLEEFREHLYNLENVDEHAEHIAGLAARGYFNNEGFQEGYGNPKDFGIDAAITTWDSMIVEKEVLDDGNST